MSLAAEFLEMQAQLIGRAEAESLARCMVTEEAPVSVRLNPMKEVADVASWPLGSLLGEEVAWSQRWGRYLTRRPSFTLDALFHGGAYYVQEASSMFVGWLAQRVLEGVSSPLVLDLCAAPGGKSTLLASVVEPLGGAVVANEVIRARGRVLSENAQKWGCDNVAVTSCDASVFGAMGELFDVVLVDAPCSGEGMFRKDAKARDEWSVENVALCASRQRRIVADVWDSLNNGGVMIYSTCTFNSSENSQNARWIASELGGEILLFDSLPEGVAAVEGGGFQFYPHRVKGEGFYAVAIRKTALGGSIASFRSSGKGCMTQLTKSQLSDVERYVSRGLEFRVGGGLVYGFSPRLFEIIEGLRLSGSLIYSGVLMGELLRDTLKPAHSLALYSGLNRDELKVSQLDNDQALDYLRKVNQRVDIFEDGLSLVTCNGVALGWNKRIGARCNNLYPTNWRIINL